MFSTPNGRSTKLCRLTTDRKPITGAPRAVLHLSPPRRLFRETKISNYALSAGIVAVALGVGATMLEGFRFGLLPACRPEGANKWLA